MVFVVPCEESLGRPPKESLHVSWVAGAPTLGNAAVAVYNELYLSMKYSYLDNTKCHVQFIYVVGSQLVVRNIELT